MCGLIGYMRTILFGCLLSLSNTQGLDDGPLKVMLHFDYGSPSHIMPLFEVGKVLRDRNHTVVYAAADHLASYNSPYGFEFKSLGKTYNDPEFIQAMMKQLYGKRERVDGDKIFTFFTHIIPLSYEAVYPRLEELIEENRPDVIVCDFFSPACRDVADMKGIPLVVGFQTTDGFGVSRAPFITNTLDYIAITTDGLSFFGRVRDKVLMPLREIYQFYPLRDAINEKRKKFNVPPSTQPLGDFSTMLGLANTFEGFEAASPLPPNVRMMGPLRAQSKHQLSPDLEAFLDSHPNTIYIAFGSKVILADFDIHNLVMGSIAALEEGSIDGVIWGLGSTSKQDFPESFSENPKFRLLDWAPQDAILNHKHTKLFISHGGLESSFEAIFSATPVLCMPFFSDQPRNARKLEDAGIGKYIDRITATPASIASHIATMLQDKDGKIKVNAKRMQTLARFGSRRRELGANSIEEYAYSARICRPSYPHKYGGIPCEAKHLIPASKNMSYIQSNLIDVYLFVAALAVTVVALVFNILLKFSRYIFKSSRDVSKKKSQ